MRIGRSLRAAREARALVRDESGVSAIEFGLVAPLIFFSFLAMFDVGMALRDRMTLDHVLRSGAQTAMRDAGPGIVLDTLKATACQNYTVPEAEVCEPDKPKPLIGGLQVESYCICPDSEEPDVDCNNTCSVRPQKFYTLSAARTYEGIFLPDMDLAPQVLVEVR